MHQERCLGIISRLLGEAHLVGERAVPRATRFIDAVAVIGGPVDGLRPILPLVLGRSLVIEHYDRGPGVPECCRAIAKLGHLVDEYWRDRPDEAESLRVAVEQALEWAELTLRWQKAARQGRELEVPLPEVILVPPDEPPSTPEPPHPNWPAQAVPNGGAAMGPRPPMLLLLAFTRPRKDLAPALWVEVPETPVEGIRFLSRPVLGDILVMENRRLPRGRPGYSVLRLMPTPRSRKGALAGIQELMEDPAVLDCTKEALMTDLASNRIQSTPDEQRSILDIAREEGRTEAWKEAEEKIAREAKARQEAEARLRVLERELAALRAGRDGPET